MPGNEFEEKIHNFFGQEGLPENQHQSQVVDESWSNFSNGLVGNQKQIGTSLVANLKSYKTQQSVDPERSQSSNSQLQLNVTQQPVRSEYSRNLLYKHQQLTNGCMHGNLGLQTMPNEANFLGMDVESSTDRLSARGFTPDLHKNPSRFEMGDSPVNFDFFGGQQQSNTQLPGMLQPFPRQQMTFNDMQLPKHQVMVKQMHEYQMQQHLQKQQLDARQLNSLNSDAVNGSLSSDNHSHTLINGIPLQDASSNGWQPDLMTRNANWMHSGMSPVVQGSPTGYIINPENRQANLLAQQFQPSLFGMPVSRTNVSENAFPSIQMNRLGAQHVSTNKSLSITNQPVSFLDQVDVQISHMLPRSTCQEKLLFYHTTAPGSNNRPNLGSLQQDDSREWNNLGQENFCQLEGPGLSDKIVKVPENINASQKTTTLNSEEEKILFGSDDNLWEAFGSSTDMSLAGNLMSSSSDLLDACPSLQSGRWSALMQSAVADTSSDEVSAHGWADNNTGSYVNRHSGNRAHDMSVEASNAPNERLHRDSTREAGQHLPGKGNQVSDHGVLEKPVAQLSQPAGNISNSSGSGIDEQNILCSFPKNEGIEDRFGNWKAASNPNCVAPIEPKNHFTQNIQMQRASYGSRIAGAGTNASALMDVRENILQHAEKAIPQLKSRDASQIHDSYASNHAGPDDMVNARDLLMLSGGKNTQSGHVGSRPSISRKFQYHPMGNIDVTSDTCQENVSNVSPTLDQVSAGNQGHFGQPESLGQRTKNMGIDFGSASQNDVNCTNEAFRSICSENSPSTSSSADRSVNRCNQVNSISSRQTILEILHKVDQSPENSSETSITTAEYGGQFQHSQSSASQGFRLRLAPPSQLAPLPDNVHVSRNSLQPLNSYHTTPEKGGTSQSRFAPNQSFPQRSTHQGPFPGVLRESNRSSGFPYTIGDHRTQQMPVATRQSGAKYSVTLSSELPALVKERDEHSDFDQHGHSAQTPSLLNSLTQNKNGDSTEEFPMLSAPQPLVASISPQRSSSSGMMSDSRAGISAPQHQFWNQPSRQEKTNQILSHNGGGVSLSGREMVNIQELQSKDMGAKQTTDVALIFSKMVQSSPQSYDRPLNLCHDEHLAGSGEGEAHKMAVTRVENSVGPQKVAHQGEQQSPSRSDGLVRNGLTHKKLVNHMLHFGQNVSQTFSTKKELALAGADHQQISPQMAPSWYNQYGTFKNGLVQPMNNTGRFTPLKIGEQNVGSFVGGIQSVQSPRQFDMQQMSASAPGTGSVSSESLPHDATDELLNVDTPKKRKMASSELPSWNIEVVQGAQRLKTLSGAEVNWARSTNRFAEKVEFETLFEDRPPMRSKRRFIYATQLMQQLFGPPPTRMIALIASTNYEFVAYTVARATLGDACSSISTNRSEHIPPSDDSNPLSSERTKTVKINDQYISKAVKDFICRTRKLETDFAGLENGTTITDLRVEVEDLEKFGVINRFARFHPPSSSMDRTGSSIRLNPQRYVTIAPMPRNIPDMVQCLSL